MKQIFKYFMYSTLLVTTFIVPIALYGESISMESVQLPAASQAQKALLSTKHAKIKMEDYYLSISASSLKKDQIFIPTFITSSLAADTPYPMMPKIVYFDKRGKSLYLMERMDHQNVPKIFEPKKILAEFPIVNERSGRILFDFKSGLDTLITDYAYSGPDTKDIAIPVFASYLGKPVVTAESFSINQVAQVGADSLTFKYLFQFDAQSSLEPKYPEEYGRIGYFQTPNSFDRGNPDGNSAIIRWNLNEPIRFYLSSNTPPQWHKYLIDGIEAWNAVLGEGAIEVGMAENGEVAGYSDRNIVQWVENDAQGFAYAFFHPHPVSGEIIDGNIFMSSAFVGAWLDKKIQDDIDDYSPKIGLMGFDFIKTCDLSAKDLAVEINLIKASGEFSESDLGKLAGYYIQAVTMHEMGHVLGLRHNFAGNLASQIEPFSNLDGIRSLLNGTRQKKAPLPSSSIMDYLAILDDILMTYPAAYDSAALKWAYFGDDTVLDTIPIFCTDEDTRVNADCTRFDSTTEPIDYYKFRVEDVISEFNEALINRLTNNREISSLTPGFFDYYFSGWMSNSVFKFKQYLSEPFVSVWPLNGKTSAERVESVHSILDSFTRSEDNIFNSPYVGKELGGMLRVLARIKVSGDTDDAQWANEAIKWVHSEIDSIRENVIITVDMMIPDLSAEASLTYMEPHLID